MNWKRRTWILSTLGYEGHSFNINVHSFSTGTGVQINFDLDRFNVKVKINVHCSWKPVRPCPGRLSCLYTITVGEWVRCGGSSCAGEACAARRPAGRPARATVGRTSASVLPSRDNCLQLSRAEFRDCLIAWSGDWKLKFMVKIYAYKKKSCCWFLRDLVLNLGVHPIIQSFYCL